MSRRKRGGGADNIYQSHLYGNAPGFANNPAANRSAIIERMYHRVLTELAVNRFKWEGLPDTVDVRFLEMCLFYNALSVFYDDPEFGYLALKGSGANYINMLDNPTGFQVVGNNFVGKYLKAKDCVPIWSNYMRIPDLDIVSIYAHRLAELDRSVEINSDNARQTKYLVVGENQRLSGVNINRAIDNGENGIQVKGGPMGDMAFIQAVDLGVNPDAIEKLDIVRARQYNVCMGLLGIENANQDKKERLVSSEVDANNDQTSSMRYVNLNARRMAATAINKKWKLDVSVRYYTDDERADIMKDAINDADPDANDDEETE